MIMTHTEPFSVGHLHFLTGLSQLSSLPICNTLFKTHRVTVALGEIFSLFGSLTVFFAVDAVLRDILVLFNI